MKLSEKLVNGGEILEPAMRSEARDLGRLILLESDQERKEFTKILHDWIKSVVSKTVIQRGWSVSLSKEKPSIPLDENPLGLAAKQSGLLVIDGVNPYTLFLPTALLPGSRKLGWNMIYGVDEVRQRPQFAHVDGLATRYDHIYEELTGLVMMMGGGDLTTGTFVGWQNDLFQSTADTLEKHKKELESAFPCCRDSIMSLDDIIAHFRAGTCARKASYELLLRMHMLNRNSELSPAHTARLTEIVQESIHGLTPVHHLELSSTRWAFLHEEESEQPCGTAHGRLNAYGDHIVMDL